MNKVFLIGNLTRDPEISVTGSGVQLCRFSIAVNRNYTNSEGNREVDFLNITTWRNLAERCGKYLHKGNKVCVSGSIQTRSYEVNGEKRNATDIVADEVEFLTPKGNSEGSAEFTPAEPKADKVVALEPVDESDLPF